MSVRLLKVFVAVGLLSFLCIALFLLATVHGAFQSALGPALPHYAILVDAGSSASRFHIYSWSEHSDTASMRASMPSITVDWVHIPKPLVDHVNPGISSMGHASLEDMASYWRPLLETTRHSLPVEVHGHVPIVILATAGMRLLSSSEQEHIMGKTCEVLQESSLYALQTCADTFRIIDGTQEGIYGFKTIQHLLQHTEYDHEKALAQSNALGFLDIGGASMQIVFPNASPTTASTPSELSDTLPWHAVSLLGYGMNELRKKYLECLVQSLPDKSNIMDPCLPKGLQLEEYIDTQTSSESAQRYSIIGSGDYLQCQQQQRLCFLESSKHQENPLIDLQSTIQQFASPNSTWLGVSEAWYSTNDLFDLGGFQDHGRLVDETTSYCESHWHDIQVNYADRPVDLFRFQMQCFKASWLTVLWQDVLPTATHSDTQHRMFTLNSVSNTKFSWTLGALLSEQKSLLTFPTPSIVSPLWSLSVWHLLSAYQRTVTIILLGLVGALAAVALYQCVRRREKTSLFSPIKEIV